ncbi:unnamed protein product [Closterium sp. NIES-54]
MTRFSVDSTPSAASTNRCVPSSPRRVSDTTGSSSPLRLELSRSGHPLSGASSASCGSRCLRAVAVCGDGKSSAFGAAGSGGHLAVALRVESGASMSIASAMIQ